MGLGKILEGRWDGVLIRIVLIEFTGLGLSPVSTPGPS